MRASSWAALFRHIPPEQQDNLMVVTKAGVEFNVNNLLRVDEEFVAFRGRLSGSQDAGRLFFIPYSNIDHCGYQKPVKDTDFQETFGSFILPESNATPTSEAAVPVAPSAAARAGNQMKSAVLERFRSRAGTIIGSAAGSPLATPPNGQRPSGEG